LATRRSDEHTRILRQSIVSSARLRGLSISDIYALFAKESIINPRTNEPWSMATIQNDLRELENQWKEEAMKNTADHRARVLAEIKEAKASAWKTGKLSLVLRAIQQEVDLLGLNELERMGVEIALANLLKGLPPEIADNLRAALSKRVAERKNLARSGKVIELNRASVNG